MNQCPERPGNFSAFSSPVYKNGKVYASETSCMKGTSVHIQNMGRSALAEKIAIVRGKI